MTGPSDKSTKNTDKPKEERRPPSPENPPLKKIAKLSDASNSLQHEAQLQDSLYKLEIKLAEQKFEETSKTAESSTSRIREDNTKISDQSSLTDIFEKKRDLGVRQHNFTNDLNKTLGNFKGLVGFSSLKDIRINKKIEQLEGIQKQIGIDRKKYMADMAKIKKEQNKSDSTTKELQAINEFNDKITKHESELYGIKDTFKDHEESIKDVRDRYNDQEKDLYHLPRSIQVRLARVKELSQATSNLHISDLIQKAENSLKETPEQTDKTKHVTELTLINASLEAAYLQHLRPVDVEKKLIPLTQELAPMIQFGDKLNEAIKKNNNLKELRDKTTDTQEMLTNVHLWLAKHDIRYGPVRNIVRALDKEFLRSVLFLVDNFSDNSKCQNHRIDDWSNTTHDDLKWVDEKLTQAARKVWEFAVQFKIPITNEAQFEANTQAAIQASLGLGQDHDPEMKAAIQASLGFEHDHDPEMKAAIQASLGLEHDNHDLKMNTAIQASIREATLSEVRAARDKVDEIFEDIDSEDTAKITALLDAVNVREEKFSESYLQIKRDDLENVDNTTLKSAAQRVEAVYNQWKTEKLSELQSVLERLATNINDQLENFQRYTDINVDKNYKSGLERALKNFPRDPDIKADKDYKSGLKDALKVSDDSLSFGEELPESSSSQTRPDTVTSQPDSPGKIESPSNKMSREDLDTELTKARNKLQEAQNSLAELNAEQKQSFGRLSKGLSEKLIKLESIGERLAKLNQLVIDNLPTVTGKQKQI